MHHMFRAIRRVLDEHPECKAVYPIHMNPVVRQAADEELGDCKQIHIIEPIEVFDCEYVNFSQCDEDKKKYRISFSGTEHGAILCTAIRNRSKRKSTIDTTIGKRKNLN